MELTLSPSPPSPQEDLQTLQALWQQLINEMGLPPTRIKRQYKCQLCEHNTDNPRNHLRHRIFAHGHKIKIVECPYCLYACQYRQKLSRHLKLVHKVMTTMTTTTTTAAAAATTTTSSTSSSSSSAASSQPDSIYDQDLEKPIDLTIRH